MIYKVEKNYAITNSSVFNFKVTTQDGFILFVPNDKNNRHYQEIQKWIAEGGVVIDNPPTQENN